MFPSCFSAAAFDKRLFTIRDFLSTFAGILVPLRFLLSWFSTALLLLVVTVVAVAAVIVASCDVNLDGSFVALDMIVAANLLTNVTVKYCDYTYTV